MKGLLLLAALFILPAMAADQPEYSEVLSCRVTKVTGQLISFLPPRVGDRFKFDASQPTITRLQAVLGHGMLPIHEPLVKNSMPDTASYLVYFQAEQYNETTQKSTLTVMMGKFSDGQGNFSRQARIQQVNTDKHTGLVQVGDAELDCQLAQ